MPATVPQRRDYEAMDRDFESDRAFVEEVERTVPDGTKVFQLPVVAFPEQPAFGEMRDYDLLRPFLQSDGSTDWSYGKVKGRPNADWQWMKVRDTYGIVDSLPALAGLGFLVCTSTSSASSTRVRSCGPPCARSSASTPSSAPTAGCSSTTCAPTSRASTRPRPSSSSWPRTARSGCLPDAK